MESPGSEILLAERPVLFITLRLVVWIVTGLSSWLSLATLGAELERFMSVCKEIMTYWKQIEGILFWQKYHCLLTHCIGMECSYKCGSLTNSVQQYSMCLESLSLASTTVRTKGDLIVRVHRMQWRMWARAQNSRNDYSYNNSCNLASKHSSVLLIYLSANSWMGLLSWL